MLQRHARNANNKFITLGIKDNKLSILTYNIGTQLYPIIEVVCKNPLINKKAKKLHITVQ